MKVQKTSRHYSRIKRSLRDKLKSAWHSAIHGRFYNFGKVINGDFLYDILMPEQ